MESAALSISVSLQYSFANREMKIILSPGICLIDGVFRKDLILVVWLRLAHFEAIHMRRWRMFVRFTKSCGIFRHFTVRD